MENYRVKMMTNKDYSEYLSGGYGYAVVEHDVMAENAEQAVEIIKNQFPGYVVNENARTVAEIERKEAEFARAHEEEQRKKEEKKARALEREEERAAEKGMTLDEYRVYKKELAKAKRYEKEVKEMEAKITALKREITRKKNAAEEIHNKYGE